MEGNKPKQQREKPVDKQNTLNLNEVPGGKPTTIEINEKDLDKESQLPDYRPNSLFTKKQIPKAKKKKLRKIARKSRQINRRLAKNK